jgi:hypothetical protein
VLLLGKVDLALGTPPGDPVEAVLTFARAIFEHAFSTLTPEVWAHAVATAITEGASEFGRGYRELVHRLAGLIEDLIGRGRLDSAHETRPCSPTCSTPSPTPASRNSSPTRR